MPQESLLTPFLNYLTHERGYADHTRKAYARDLNDLREFLRQTYKLDPTVSADIARIDLRQLRRWLGHLVQKDYANRTRARKMSAVRTYFDWLCRRSLIARNPAASIRIPKAERNLPTFFKESETEDLLAPGRFSDDFTGARDRAILEILYGCGLRRSELIALRRDAVDSYERSLRVRGKGNRERIIPFGEAVQLALDAYYSAARAAGVSLDQALFVRPDGKPLYPKLVYRLVRKYTAEVSSPASPHTIRHTYATHLLDHGADLNAIKELLGHQSLAATQVYTHNSISKLKSVYERAHPRGDSEAQ